MNSSCMRRPSPACHNRNLETSSLMRSLQGERKTIFPLRIQTNDEIRWHGRLDRLSRVKPAQAH
jgi:hypothetical protein